MANNEVVDFDELVPVGPPPCSHPSDKMEPFAGPIKYPGSCLEPFHVEGAAQTRCLICGETFYARGEARQWEIRKAKEVVRTANPLTPLEFRFLRQTIGLTQADLAGIFRMDKATISRWETQDLPSHADRMMRMGR